MRIDNRDLVFILGVLVIILFLSCHFLQSIYYYTGLLYDYHVNLTILEDTMIWIAIILQIILIIIKSKEVRR